MNIDRNRIRTKPHKGWSGRYLRQDDGREMKDPTMEWFDDLEQAINFYLLEYPDVEVEIFPDDPGKVRIGYFYD